MKTLFANFYRYLFFCCLVFAMGLGLEARAAVCEQAVTGGTVSYILVSPGNYRVQYTCDYILTGVNNCNFQYNASSTPGDYATLLFQKADSDGYVWAADFSSTLVSGQLVWGFYCAFAKDGGGEVVVNPFPNTANVSDFTSCALPDAPVYTPSLSDIIVYSSYDNSTLITNYNEYTNVTAHEAVTTEGGYDVMKLSMGGNGGSWATHGAFLRTSSLNISGMDYIHVDLYVPDPGEATPIRYVRLGIGEEYTYYSLAEVSFNEWMSVEIPITNFPTLGAGKLVSFNNIEIVFTTNKSADIPAYTYSFYFDNLYFYNAGCGGAPATSAPTPNRPAAKVKSVYSDTYVREDVTSFSTNPLFGFAANATEVEVPASSGNHAYVYENIAKTGGHYQIGYQTNQVDVSSMDGIQFDIFTT
ncbi:MAG: hypothetical protein J5808_02190, partial [Paludibacteraceae bacterium]|nr:hypothetical protein [Paludibacteraceae bacterium]